MIAGFVWVGGLTFMYVGGLTPAHLCVCLYMHVCTGAVAGGGGAAEAGVHAGDRGQGLREAAAGMVSGEGQGAFGFNCMRACACVGDRPLMPPCPFPQVYKDFVQTPSGLQYKDVREGSGNSPGKGDRVVVDWEGYTIGYYGRIFEAKGKTKGGAFDAAVRYRLFFCFDTHMYVHPRAAR